MKFYFGKSTINFINIRLRLGSNIEYTLFGDESFSYTNLYYGTFTGKIDRESINNYSNFSKDTLISGIREYLKEVRWK